MLTALIDECESKGFRQMLTIVGDGQHGLIASLRLHEAMGFQIVGVVKNIGFKHGRWLDQLLLQRVLGEGAGKVPV